MRSRHVCARACVGVGMFEVRFEELDALTTRDVLADCGD